MSLKQMQLEIYENKIRQDFNVTDIGKEIITLAEELGELARAYRDSDKRAAWRISNRDNITDAIGDIMVYCLGLCEMMNVDSTDLLKQIIHENNAREYRSHL